MVAALFRLVLFAFIAYVVFLFFRVGRGLKQARRQAGPRTPGPVEGVMVKDEICGTYIPRDEALTEVQDGVVHYLCSEDCRRRLKTR